MEDSISLVRQRVGDPILSCGDETMDAVVTLAAIEVTKISYFLWKYLHMADTESPSSEREISPSAACTLKGSRRWCRSGVVYIS